MTTTDMHPPTDRRCQIYLTDHPAADYHAAAGSSLFRCQNEGVRWEKWGGCNCAIPDSDVCEGDYYSWECDGNHAAAVAA